MKNRDLAITVNVREMVDVGKVAEQIHRAGQKNHGCRVTIFVNGAEFDAPQDGSAGTPRQPDETPEERKARRLADRLAAEAEAKEHSLL